MNGFHLKKFIARENRMVIDVAFRYDKKYDEVVMFYYDEHKTLICFTLGEGHSEASYEYYRSIKHLNKPTKAQAECIKNYIKYYEGDGEIKLRVMKRLKYRHCSYA